MSLLKSIPDVPNITGREFFLRLRESAIQFLTGKGQIFPIWAQEGGGLADATFEWSFGDGVASGQDSGLVIAVDCELFALSMNIDGGWATVEIAKNGQVFQNYSVTVTNANNAYREFSSTLKFSKGDLINFRTQITDGTSGPCVVCAWLKTR